MNCIGCSFFRCNLKLLDFVFRDGFRSLFMRIYLIYRGINRDREILSDCVVKILHKE